MTTWHDQLSTHALRDEIPGIVRMDPDALVRVEVAAVQQDIDRDGRLVHQVTMRLPIRPGDGNLYLLTGTKCYPETPGGDMPDGWIAHVMNVRFGSVKWSVNILPDYATILRDAQIDALVTIRKIADAIELLSREPGACHEKLATIRADADGLLLKIDPKGEHDATV